MKPTFPGTIKGWLIRVNSAHLNKWVYIVIDLLSNLTTTEGKRIKIDFEKPQKERNANDNTCMTTMMMTMVTAAIYCVCAGAVTM